MSTTDTTCTCPSGDGSLRWPCPTHPPTERDERLRGIQERRKAVSDGPWEADGGVDLADEIDRCPTVRALDGGAR